MASVARQSRRSNGAKTRTSSGSVEEYYGGPQIILVGLGLLCIPFLPASNLFFPVGFVVAERILYIPSMGFSLLVAYGFYTISRYSRVISSDVQKLIKLSFVILIASHVIKTCTRNRDWKNEFSIFKSGIAVTKGTNAKLLNNVGHALEATQSYLHALRYFEQAAMAQPDDVGAHINVGRTYNNMNNFAMAESAYIKARSLLPQPRPGQPYTARIAPQHLSVFLNLGNLIAKKGGIGTSHLEEADHLYRQAIAMRADYVQAYINRGDVLIKMGKAGEAYQVYQEALQFEPDNADLHYNLGVVLIELGKPNVALEMFNNALEVDPEHLQSLMNSAILMQESGLSEVRPLAFERLHKVLERQPDNDRAYFNLAMLSMDQGNLAKAEVWFKNAIELQFKSI